MNSKKFEVLLMFFFFVPQDKLFAPRMVENLGKSALSTHLHVWNWTPKNPRKCIFESG